MLLTVYGVNNIGKSTQIRLLANNLKGKGYKVEVIKFPAYEVEPTGVYLNKFLRSGTHQEISEEELQFWFTLNRFQFEPKLKKMLEVNDIVIAEDYIGTGLAWGAAKGGDLEWLKEINKHLLKEDCSILLTGRRTLKAKEKGHLHEENDELVIKCGKILLELADDYGWSKIEIQKERKDTAELLLKEVEEKFLQNK